MTLQAAEAADGQLQPAAEAEGEGAAAETPEAEEGLYPRHSRDAAET